MTKAKFTYAILLNATNAHEIAYFEDISVGSAANLIARDLRSVAHVALDHFILFGYDTNNGIVNENWVIISEKQLEENFKPVTANIRHTVVRVFYKD